MTAKILVSKKILILFPHMVVHGGALSYVLRLAEELTEKGAKVGIITMQHDPTRLAMPRGVEVLTVNGPLTSSLWYWLFFPFWQRKISRIIHLWQPDLIIPQVFPSNWWGWIYRQQHPVPLLWLCHEPSAFIHSRAWIQALKPRWKSLIARLLYPILSRLDVYLGTKSDFIVANSYFTAAEVERIYGQHPIAVAYPPVDFDFFSPGDEEREDSVITVAALSRFKRVDFLIGVFAKLLQHHPRLVYHIVGRGDEEERLKALAESLGVGARVLFHGSVGPEKLRNLYRHSLLFLHGGIDEPFGLAPVEAMACGTPIVAHRSGGPKEYVTDISGRVIRGESEDEWTHSIHTFIVEIKNDELDQKQVAQAARNLLLHNDLSSLCEKIISRSFPIDDCQV